MAAKSTRKELLGLAEEFEERARNIRSVVEMLNGHLHARARSSFTTKFAQAVRIRKAAKRPKRKEQEQPVAQKTVRNGMGPILQAHAVAANKPIMAADLLEAVRAEHHAIKPQAIGAAIRYRWLRRMKDGTLVPGKAKAPAPSAE